MQRQRLSSQAPQPGAQGRFRSGITAPPPRLLLRAGCLIQGAGWLLLAAAGSCCQLLLLAATYRGWLPDGCCWLLLVSALGCSWLLLATTVASSDRNQIRAGPSSRPAPRTVLLGKPRKISIGYTVPYKSMARARRLSCGPLVQFIHTQTTDRPLDDVYVSVHFPRGIVDC